ncbi:helix-turn-helix domain-containing protein [Kosakonia cowanii]|uniref:helix-turn-helix domain-containing protein n=1 Tax=Kosakonia cowanii TaxID=208223 RepID=UPI0023F8F472|nr:helix-turn-helix domain-containing protein [Kosakonia cowanii]MDF7759680.1 helix-turn-helix domain-containing protein [Kosakonia cowanii]
MSENKMSVQDVVDRIAASYSVSSQKALAEALDVPANNISSWIQRESVPYKAVVKCALDTGADLHWLVNGEFANANLVEKPQVKGKALYEEILSAGGRPVLRRILDAYGFQMQKDLGDLLDISSGTISTWVRRDFFPGDVVVTCALDTGVSLKWLATGQGEMYPAPVAAQNDAVITIPKFRHESGELKEAGVWTLDPSLAPAATDSLRFIDGLHAGWLVDTAAQKIGNGRWVIGVDDALDVFDVVRLPGGKVRLSNNAVDFECGVAEIAPFGVVLFTLEKHV